MILFLKKKLYLLRGKKLKSSVQSSSVRVLSHHHRGEKIFLQRDVLLLGGRAALGSDFIPVVSF